MECTQLSLFVKMYQERSVPTAERTSVSCWKSLPAWNNQTLQFLDLRWGADGAKPEQSPETDGAWLGDSLTLNIGESPNAERESLLSWILEVNAPEKYYLSARACQGILIRASRRGKKLPDLLQTAMLEMIEWWEPGAAAKAMEMLIAEEQKRIRRDKLTALNERKERIREKAEKQLRTLLKIRSGCAGGGKGALVQTEKVGTLSTLQDQTLFQAIPVLNDQGGGAMSVSYNMTGTLRAAEHGHQPIVFESNAQPIVLESNQIHATITQTGICPTLPASMGLGGGNVPMVTERKIFDARGNGDGRTCPTITGDHENRITDYTAIAIERQTFSEQSFSHYKESDKCSTLKAKAGNIGNGSECLIAEKAIRWIVRRLTPVECERLQGFPDNYTNIGDWTDSKGKKHKYADSPRYKALGNSIALPQWFWLVQRMRPYLKEKPTLGSLFDGLGGFPLVWQRAYGEGTARWASEIEEFPMAVTKRRFGEE